MSMVREIPGEKEALDEIEPQYRAALAHRDTFPKEAHGSYQEGIDKEKFPWGGTFANADPEYASAQAEVLRLSDEKNRARRSYFRLNVWGMARYRDVMELVGMGHWSDQPDFPDVDNFGITSTQAWSISLDDDSETIEDDETWNGLDDATKAQVRKYHDAVREALSAHPGETPGIPLWKFCSNDGWHVTPIECSSALQILGEWLIEGYQGAEAFNVSWTWEDALTAYRKADQVERTIIVANAALRHEMEAVPVGHPPFTADEQDDRTNQLDVLAEDYWLQWLQYLTDGVHAGGFRVH